MKHDKKFAKFIFKNGKQYIPAISPESIQRGPIGKCYDRSIISAINSDLTYVEGLARDPRNKERWILHAWLTDGIHAFDPTWIAYSEQEEIPVPTIYIGIEMRVHDVARFFSSTKYAGIFSNAWRDPTLAGRCVPDIPIEKISREFYIVETLKK